VLELFPSEIDLDVVRGVELLAVIGLGLEPRVADAWALSHHPFEKTLESFEKVANELLEYLDISFLQEREFLLGSLNHDRALNF
jgi:hypothetical protein